MFEFEMNVKLITRLFLDTSELQLWKYRKLNFWKEMKEPFIDCFSTKRSMKSCIIFKSIIRFIQIIN